MAGVYLGKGVIGLKALPLFKSDFVWTDDFNQPFRYFHQMTKTYEK